jgi:plasmid stabilization system protein ParE
MRLSISWSPEAIDDYDANIDYLLKEWSFKDAEEFVDNAAGVIHIISLMPETFPMSDYKKVRKAVICKQINLLYVVHKSEVILLRFWNNSQTQKDLQL